MGHIKRADLSRVRPAGAAVVAATALLWAIAPPALAGISKAELTKLTKLATSEAHSLKIKHPVSTAVQTTYSAYHKAFPGTSPPTPPHPVTKIYVVQIAGKYSAVGHTFKAFDLVVNAKNGKTVLGFYASMVDKLSVLGKTYKL